MFIKLFFIILFVFSCGLRASDVTIIELHKNKSLDQLVLEDEKNIANKNSEENYVNNESGNENIELLDNSENDQDKNTNSEEVTIINPESIFDIDEKIIQNHFVTIKQIKSKH